MAIIYEQYPRTSRYLTEQVLTVLKQPQSLLNYIDQVLVPHYEQAYEHKEIYGGYVDEAMQWLGVENYQPKDVIDVAILQSIYELLVREHNMSGRLGPVSDYLSLPTSSQATESSEIE